MVSGWPVAFGEHLHKTIILALVLPRGPCAFPRRLWLSGCIFSSHYFKYIFSLIWQQEIPHSYLIPTKEVVLLVTTSRLAARTLLTG